MIGKPPADRHALPFVEAFERALADIVGNAAHQYARRIEGRRRQRLPLDDRRGKQDARHFRNPLGHSLPIGERLLQRLDQEVAVDAQDLVQQLLAETIHHRHHDDEGGDAKHDAEKRESGIDRDEALLPPRTQIAQREHPFERRERAGAGRLVHRSVPRLRFSQDSGRFRPSSATGFSTNKACSGLGHSPLAGEGWRARASSTQPLDRIPLGH